MQQTKCNTSNADPHEEGLRRPPRDGLIQGLSASQNLESKKETLSKLERNVFLLYQSMCMKTKV